MTTPTTTIGDLFDQATVGESPMAALQSFLESEARHRAADAVDSMRFIGYVLDLGYDTAKIITSDPYKIAVGGVPRGSFLMMIPTGRSHPGRRRLPPHFTLLRVMDVATTPLASQVQQTYFELHKKAMPELDVWTAAELQWGALECQVLGMFYTSPSDNRQLAFSGDVNSIVSAHRYEVFAPDEKLLSIIVNGMVPAEKRTTMGRLRIMECELGSTGETSPIEVAVSMSDFAGRRTAMFGKTRLGKSNVVKLLAQAMLDVTKNAEGTVADPKVGQLIFDLNGEYANDNTQDGDELGTSLRSANDDRCTVYALATRAGTVSKPLSLNFYAQPESCMSIIRSLLENDGQNSNYITSFSSVDLPSTDEVAALSMSGTSASTKIRASRQIQIYWAILHKAGFPADQAALRQIGLRSSRTSSGVFDPAFSAAVRKVIGTESDPAPDSLDALVKELAAVTSYMGSGGPALPKSSSGNNLFSADDEALLQFFDPGVGRSGPTILRKYRVYHDPRAGDFVKEILIALDKGETVILDLGNAGAEIRAYFSNLLSRSVFAHQETKFVNANLLGGFVQLYFEEAHNLFPVNDRDLTGSYARFAKEGAKFHIGMVYSTQSPSTISSDLLDQTENFFIGHLSSQQEAAALAKRQIAFSGVEKDILHARTPGFVRMLTQSHRFVIPVQANRYDPLNHS